MSLIKRNRLMLYLYDTLKLIYFKYLFSNKKLIKKRFKKRVGRKVNLKAPIAFTDKLQWLKLYWYDPLATQCADKYEVRKYIRKKADDQYLNKLIGVYESVDEININNLPKSFVLKGTHGSGYNIVCKDKEQMDWNKEFKKMRRWLRNNYYWSDREWVYKDIKPRIICEKFLTDDQLNSNGLVDYKFYCFNGTPYFCQVIRDRSGEETIDFFDMRWNHMPFVGMRLLPNSKNKMGRPDKYDKMIKLAENLSQGFPFVRVDLYYVNKKVYFGEMTFFPTSGMGKFDPPKWDEKLGELLELPNA